MNKKSEDILKASSIEGQKQLMKFGENMALNKQIEEIRNEKEEKLQEYITNMEDILEIPKALKKESYSNSIRNFCDVNSNFVKERYYKNNIDNKLNSTNFSSTNFGQVNCIDEKLILNDIVNLYYAFRLKEIFRKRLLSEIDKDKKQLKSFKEDYNDLVKENNSLEDSIELYEKNIFKIRILMYVLIITNIITGTLFSFYINRGSSLLYEDFIKFSIALKDVLYLFLKIITGTIHYVLSMYTDVPEYVRSIYLLVIFTVGSLIYLNKLSVNSVSIHISNNLYNIRENVLYWIYNNINIMKSYIVNKFNWKFR